MKTKRCVYLVIGLVTLVAVGVTGCSKPKSLEKFQDLPGLVSAIQAFSQDLTKKGQSVPSTVSLSELVNGGFISSNSVSAFEGMDTRIWLKSDSSELQSVLMSARLPDGTINAALADGSVQQFSAQKFAEHLKKTGQE